MRSLLILLTAIALIPSVYAVWEADSTINASLPNVGIEAHPTFFHKDGTLYVLFGRNAGDVWGFNWTGSAWQADYGINASLPGIGPQISIPYVFFNDSTWYMLLGRSGGVDTEGYNWTGSAWQADYGINASLSGSMSPSIFFKDGTWYIIDTEFDAYNWTGSAWQADYGINASLPNVGGSDPHVFFKDGTWYLLSQWVANFMQGFNWTGTAWQADYGINASLSGNNIFVFELDGELYCFISGEKSFKWDESTTPDVTINSPLDDTTTTSTSVILNATSTDSNMAFYWYNNSDFIISSETPINDTSLVGAWHLGEGDGNSWISNQNVSDYSAYSNDGEIFGVEYVRGRYEKGMEFDGINSNIKLGDAPEFDTSLNNSFTFTAWIYPYSTTNQMQIVSKWDTTGADRQYQFVVKADNELRLSVDPVGDGANDINHDSTSTIVGNTWNFVVGMYNGTNICTSIDAGAFECTAYALGVADRGETLFIGARDDSSTSLFFNGTINEVRIYNRSLSSTEILDNYNLGLGYYNWTHQDIETTYTMLVNASDSYANATATSSLTIDYTHITLYDETSGTHFGVNDTLPINFMNGTSFLIHNATTGNNITLNNLDSFIGEQVRVEAKNTTHGNYPYPRSVVSSAYVAGEDFDIYLPSTTDSVVAPTLVLTDITGDFPALTTVLRVKRYIGTSLITIFEDFFDIERDASPYLIVDVRYQVTVDNGVEEREMGHYVPEVAETVTIFTGPIQYAPGDNINDVINWNITEGSVEVNYHDSSGNTTYLEIVMYNESNHSIILVNCSSVDTSTVTCIYNPTENMSIYINITANTGYGVLTMGKLYEYFSGAVRRVDLGLLEPWHYTLISLLGVMVLFLAFNEVNSGIGAVVSVGALGLLRYLGWISINASIMALLVLFAFFAFMRRERR